MGSYHGKDGSVQWINSTAIDKVTSWSLTTVADTAEYTSMDDAAAGYKVYLPGFLDWTATVECVISNDGLYPDLDNTGIQDTDGAALILNGGQDVNPSAVGSTQQYSGNAICTGITTTLDLNDVIKVTYNFEGSGTLTEASDT